MVNLLLFQTAHLVALFYIVQLTVLRQCFGVILNVHWSRCFIRQISYSVVSYLYVSFSGLITSGERELIFLLSLHVYL